MFLNTFFLYKEKFIVSLEDRHLEKVLQWRWAGRGYLDVISAPSVWFIIGHQARTFSTHAPLGQLWDFQALSEALNREAARAALGSGLEHFSLSGEPPLRFLEAADLAAVCRSLSLREGGTKQGRGRKAREGESQGKIPTLRNPALCGQGTELACGSWRERVL